MQTLITEHKVYDGRKFKTNYVPLAADLKESPCYECKELFKPCNPTECQKMTAWLIATGGN